MRRLSDSYPHATRGGMTSDSVFRLDEAAAFLQLSSRTVVKLATSGVLIGRKVGKQWRFLRSDLEAYVHGGTKQAAS